MQMVIRLMSKAVKKRNDLSECAKKVLSLRHLRSQTINFRHYIIFNLYNARIQIYLNEFMRITLLSENYVY